MSELLRAEGVCKYFGGLRAVENVDMEVAQGDVLGIIGPNGAGKTTFFNVCTGIYAPTKGKVYLEDKDISGFSPDKVAACGMARTFQNIQLFKYLTVQENVKIGFHLHTKTRFWDAIFHTGSYRQDEKMINDVSEIILERVGLSKYSGTLAGMLPYGVQRKVEIARALALRPKLLLLDEPAAGMNPQETMELSEFICALNADGYTIVLIEHDMRFVMNTCNRVLVLNFGKKICEGSPDTVRADQNVHEAYFGKGFIAGEAVKNRA